MSKASQGSQAIDRAIRLLLTIVEGRGEKPLADAARELGLPLSTAHRMVGRLESYDLLIRTARGRYQGGMALARCAGQIDGADLLARAARPALRALAHETDRTAHLGIFEDEMVTYLVREAPSAGDLFTREAMQLEAYCSAIGKVLLAGLPDQARARYVSDGTLVPLTAKTIVDPDALHAHLSSVALVGHAIDDEEIEEGLFCIAVPLKTPAGLPNAALSLAGSVPTEAERHLLLNSLDMTAQAIATAVGG